MGLSVQKRYKTCSFCDENNATGIFFITEVQLSPIKLYDRDDTTICNRELIKVEIVASVRKIRGQAGRCISFYKSRVLAFLPNT
jgi:hypothetical protein